MNTSTRLPPTGGFGADSARTLQAMLDIPRMGIFGICLAPPNAFSLQDATTETEISDVQDLCQIAAGNGSVEHLKRHF